MLPPCSPITLLHGWSAPLLLLQVQGSQFCSMARKAHRWPRDLGPLRKKFQDFIKHSTFLLSRHFKGCQWKHTPLPELPQGLQTLPGSSHLLLISHGSVHYSHSTNIFRRTEPDTRTPGEGRDPVDFWQRMCKPHVQTPSLWTPLLSHLVRDDLHVRLQPTRLCRYGPTRKWGLSHSCGYEDHPRGPGIYFPFSRAEDR